MTTKAQISRSRVVHKYFSFFFTSFRIARYIVKYVISSLVSYVSSTAATVLPIITCTNICHMNFFYE